MSRTPVTPGVGRTVGNHERLINELARRPGPSPNGGYSSPIVIPFGAMFTGSVADQTPGLAWDSITDLTVRGGSVWSNTQGGRTPALNDRFSVPVTLGPKGALYGLVGWYKTQPDGGRFKVRLASVPTPNPNRAAVDDDGTLQESGDLVGNYHEINGIEWDTYQAGAPSEDTGANFIEWFRVGGEEGDPFTTTIGTDPYALTGDVLIIDGGPGPYRLEVEVTGTNPASTGDRYLVELTQWAWMRLDDEGYY